MSPFEHYKLRVSSTPAVFGFVCLAGPCRLSNAQMVVLYERLELGFPKVSLRLRGQVYTWGLE